MKPPAVLAPALVVVVAAAGCVHVSRLSYPAPPATVPTVVAATTSTSTDLAGVSLAAVAGRTTTTLGVGPGGATLTGTVVGPAGPVGAAVIHIERLAGDSVATVDVTARADGTWALPAVHGGRYRVRAWRAPDLAQTDPQTFYLAATATWSATLRLQLFNRPHLAAAIAPNPPVVGQPAVLTVQLTTQTVDTAGIVRARPVAGAAIALSTGGSWTLSGSGATVTAADGSATWPVNCATSGLQLLAATVNGVDAYPVPVPACLPPPTTTTAAPAVTTTARTTGRSGPLVITGPATGTTVAP